MKIYIFPVIYENSAHFLRFGEQGISYLDGYVVVPPVPYDYLQKSKASLFLEWEAFSSIL